MIFNAKIRILEAKFFKLRFKEFINRLAHILCLLTVIFHFCSCNKLVQIPEPQSTITSTEVFSNAADATSAITAIYNQMSWNTNSLCFSNGAASICAGLSADELKPHGGFGVVFQLNSLLPSNGLVNNFFWSKPYFNIYQANTAIEELQASSSLSKSVKDQLIGEAKFLRAFAYFYLVNFFGDVPLATTSSFEKNSLLSRDSAEKIYQQVISDLKDAQNLLPREYSAPGGAKTRANRWAATSLLARAYLYKGDWVNAHQEASLVINNTDLYQLDNDLNNVFLPNSSEAILQLEVANAPPYATLEGYNFVPAKDGNLPTYTLSPELLAAFEPDDARRSAWVGSSTFSGTTYYYPYKYKTRQGTAGNIGESYMLLRLAEQYLIKAEAEANGAEGGITAAITDLNSIRNRAGLSNYSGSSDQVSVLNAIYHERQIEFFAEWGHRWLDLKRWGTATQVLTANKGFNVAAYMLLYPIPMAEIQTDPNLKQNPGYH